DFGRGRQSAIVALAAGTARRPHRTEEQRHAFGARTGGGGRGADGAAVLCRGQRSALGADRPVADRRTRNRAVAGVAPRRAPQPRGAHRARPAGAAFSCQRGAVRRWSAGRVLTGNSPWPADTRPPGCLDTLVVCATGDDCLGGWTVRAS